MNIRKIIKEEIDDFDWIRNAAINFEDVNLRVGDKFRVPTLNPDGSTFSIVTIIDIGLRGNEPITYRRESGMGQLQQRNLVDSKVDFIRRIIKDKWEPFYHNRGFKLYESDDFDWVRDERDPWADIPQEDIDKLTEDEMDLIYYIFEWDDEGWRYENNCIPFREIMEVDFDESPNWSRGIYHGIKRELFVSFKVRCSDADDWVYVTAFIDRDTHDWHVA